MTIIKNLLARVFALWAIIVFVITMLLLYIPILIVSKYPEPRKTIAFFHISRLWMDIWFTLVGVRRIITGTKNFKRGENYVVVCNHSSFMDIPLSSPGIPGANKTIAKIEMTRIPLFGMIYRLGSVLVDRKNDESRKTSFLKMKEILETGLHMCIYPEGTRNKTKEPLQKFYDGAFRLAVDSSKPVMPAVIFYTTRVMPRDKTFYFWPHKVEMHFLPPVYPGQLTVQELRDAVYHQMKEAIATRIARN